MNDAELAAIRLRLKKGYPSRRGRGDQIELAKEDVKTLIEAYEQLETIFVVTITMLGKVDKPAAVGILRAQAGLEKS